MHVQPSYIYIQNMLCIPNNVESSCKCSCYAAVLNISALPCIFHGQTGWIKYIRVRELYIFNFHQFVELTFVWRSKDLSVVAGSLFAYILKTNELIHWDVKKFSFEAQITSMRWFLQFKHWIRTNQKKQEWSRPNEFSWMSWGFHDFCFRTAAALYITSTTSSVTLIWNSNVYLYFLFIVPHNSKWTSFPWCLQIVKCGLCWRKRERNSDTKHFFCWQFE